MGRPAGSESVVWDGVRKNQLAALVNEGHSPEAVAQRMKIPRSSVQAQAKRQQLTFAPRSGCKWRPEEDETMVDLAHAGLDAQQIAQRLPGREPEGVYSRARTLRARGIDLPLPKLDRSATQNRAQASEACSLAALSLPLHRIAEAFK